MSSSWKDKFTPPKGTTHKVGDEEFAFFPVSVNCAVRLKALGAPLVNALSTLFSKERNKETDVKSVATSCEATETEPATKQVVVEGISPELAKLRHKQSQDAVNDALEAVTSKANVGIVGDLIVDSMRELFPPGDKENPPGAEVANWFDIVQMREVLTGVAKANTEVFGPLANRVTQELGAALRRTPGTTSTTESSNSSEPALATTRS